MEKNKTITCKDCGNEFIFNESEQNFYKEHDLVEPKRCRPCREIKKLKMKEAANSSDFS